MRILVNTYPVAMDCPGGGEVQLLESRRALQRAGVEVLLFDPWQPQFDEVDVVHYFSVQGGSMNFCSHVKRRGLPLLISPILWLTPELLPCLPLGEIRDLLHLCDRVLPNSRAEQQQLSEFFDLDSAKCTVTRNGIAREFERRGEPSLFRRTFNIDGPFLLNVANIEPRKNQLRLIRAARDLDMPIVNLGHIRDREYAQACARDGKDLLRCLGHVPHGSELLRSAYAACEVFVLPSTLETPGLAALEAAAQGARVVVTAVGSAREYFGDGATYVDPTDDASIRAGIISARARAADPGLAAHVIQRFTWDNTARQLLDAYRAATVNNCQLSVGGV